jgi:hypothetical protein
MTRQARSPTALRESFRFFFYSNERGEPPHVHVKTGSGEAKFWLFPTVELESASKGMKRSEVRKALRIIRRNRDKVHGEWREFFARR